jgi:hypothetical protein
MKSSALWAGMAGGLLLAMVGVAHSAPPNEPAAKDDANVVVPLKDFDCGSKEKPCPLQGWMKAVMAAASGSGDGAKLGAALDKVAAKPPPGMPDWSKISQDGAAKAKKGDLDGAKESCKKCHDAYKDKYKDEIRDRAWP